MDALWQRILDISDSLKNEITGYIAAAEKEIAHKKEEHDRVMKEERKALQEEKRL